MNSHEVFIHIHQGCFAGTGAIVRLPQCQWSKPDGYGEISQCITTTKHSKAKTVCIFLGIYCTHWGRVTHICVSKLIIISPDNGLSPGRRQAIIWTNAGILLIGPLGTNFSKILIEILTFSLKKNVFYSAVCEIAPFLSRPQCVNHWNFSTLCGHLPLTPSPVEGMDSFILYSRRVLCHVIYHYVSGIKCRIHCH